MSSKNSGLPTALDAYFAEIARLASDAVASQWPGPGPAPGVTDDAQQPRSSAWAGIAVHPMSMLETAYVRIVQEAEAAAGNDVEQARENAFKALSGFFTLQAGDPVPLGVGVPPLIDEAMKDLAAALDHVETLADDDDPNAYDLLIALIEDGAELIGRITSETTLDHASEGVRRAARYLGLFQVQPSDAGRHWARQHPEGPPETTRRQLAEVRTECMEPLFRPSPAAASPRSLYNIGPFYLYRLMHRFLGGADGPPMTLSAKGVASGAATAALNRPDWLWLTEWFEHRIVALKQDVDELDGELRAKFGIDRPVLRFHLKGGRAMYVALGQPELGRNDWDTGILINPFLKPEHWYEAFRQVNDLVLRFLDRARFSYTELLNAHANDLDTAAGAATLTSLAVEDDLSDPDEMPEFTRLALFAEYGGEVAPTGMCKRVPATREGVDFLLEARARPVGVNGELVDIGVSTRNSVELLEHWRRIEVETGPGSTLDGIPVPALPYFVDDFSTIIREAIAFQTVDRKLAKRLLRLRLVLLSDKPSIVDPLRHRRDAISLTLPKATEALGLNRPKLLSSGLIWGLDALLTSVSVFFTGSTWVAAFDDYIARRANALLNPESISEMWSVIGPEIADEIEREECEQLFLAQNAVSVLSRRVLEDRREKSYSIGSHFAPDEPLWPVVSRALHATLELTPVGSRNGEFYLTSGMASEMQRGHLDVALPRPGLLASGGAAEMLYRPGNVPAGQALKALADRLSVVLLHDDCAVAVESANGVDAVVVRTKRPLGGVKIKPEDASILVVHAEGRGEDAQVLDSIDGYVVASTRDLARVFADRASRCEDYDQRMARKSAYRFLLTDVLGRQLKAIDA